MSRSAFAVNRGRWHSGQFLMLITRSKLSALVAVVDVLAVGLEVSVEEDGEGVLLLLLAMAVVEVDVEVANVTPPLLPPFRLPKPNPEPDIEAGVDHSSSASEDDDDAVIPGTGRGGFNNESAPIPISSGSRVLWFPSSCLTASGASGLLIPASLSLSSPGCLKFPGGPEKLNLSRFNNGSLTCCTPGVLTAFGVPTSEIGIPPLSTSLVSLRFSSTGLQSSVSRHWVASA